VKRKISSYVALGDSLSEGLGDTGFAENRIHCGWTDRLASLLSLQAMSQGRIFKYSNLAIRGSKISDIMGAQLEAALLLKPDLVSIMAGQNDFVSGANNLDSLEQQLRDGITRLKSAGCQVVISNTINPVHISVFRVVSVLASRMTVMIERVACDLEVPLLDVHRIPELSSIKYWAEDMVHFSNHGHIRVANQAAKLLELSFKIDELDEKDIESPNRNFVATTQWIAVHVLPFFWRRIRRVSSGVGISPKLPKLCEFSPRQFAITACSESANPQFRNEFSMVA
jgi:lysophospholipase L1-like esterase